MKLHPDDYSRYMGFHADALARIPQPALGMVHVLLAANLDPELDPVALDEWRNWWAQPSEKAWAPVLPQRSFVRALPQRARAFAEVGLDVAVRDRPSQDAPLRDKGVLARVAGLEWEVGLAAVLDKLSELPAAQSQLLLADAIAHAVYCQQPISVACMVKWAHEQGWSGQDIGLLPSVVGDCWLLWFSPEIEDEPSLLRDRDMLLDQVVALSSVRPGNHAETGFWKSLVEGTGAAVGHAVSAWCERYPAAWDRMHARALVDSGIPNAFLAACEHALLQGTSCSLWQNVLISQSLPSWLRRTGWGTDSKASPLASWWLRWMDIQEGRALKAPTGAMSPAPGRDPVSASLREAGAVEPGSAEDRKMGARSFAALLRPAQVEPAWFHKHPHWVYNDPDTNSNPIFHCRSCAEMETWLEIGFDPAAINIRGNMALCVFIHQAGNRNRGSVASYLATSFEDDRFPALGLFEGKTMAGLVARLHNEDASFAWLRARMRDPTPATVAETTDLAQEGSAFVLRQWVLRLCERGQWTPAHVEALWSRAAFRDLNEDAETWEEILQEHPLVEREDEPLWVRVWTSHEADHRSAPQYLDALAFLKRHGALEPSMHHPCWGRAEVMRIFSFTLCSPNQADPGIIAPGDATARWWCDMLADWLSSPEGPRTAPQMQCWLAAGLPLDDQVVGMLADRSMEFVDVPDGAWFENAQVAAAIQAHGLRSSTPTPSTGKPRRF